MEIKKLFKKDIKRDIQGVVTIGNEEESRKKQELEEYVCTNEVVKNFRSFFSAYRKSVAQPTENIGVWITGFFGSGKSHFLKILGYLLSNEVVAGKHAIDYFEDKIQDATIKADMELSAKQNNLVVLFNIDSKARADSKNRNVSIMETMLGAFNEKLGYSGSTLWIAQLERELDNDGLYEKFIETIERLTGKKWTDARRAPLMLTEKIAVALSELRGIPKEDARNYVIDAQKTYSLNTEEFSEIVAKYIEKTGRRVIFLIDEVGQYIGTRGELMLGLQTVEEELGKACKGKAWIAVTSQQEIKDLIDGANRNAQLDFSKIQGRFATRLMMSSSNADEVIKKRLLEKTDDARNYLGTLYQQNKDRLNNLLMFPQKPKWTGYQDEVQFVDCYPFVNYQFELLQMTFTAIREGGMSEGKHISSGERSLMNAFQKSAILRAEKEDGLLVPFNAFYETIEEFMDHDIKQIFARAEKRLENPNDIEVLKVLFMLKNVKEMEPTLERIATLMVSDIHEDKKVLKDRIKESLDRLVDETLAQRNGERYEFLTNKEQDVNRDIKKATYSTAEVLTQVRNIIFDNIAMIGNKFNFGKYQFGLNRFIDNNIQGSESPDNLSIKIYTPWAKNDVTDMAVASMSSDALVIDLTNGQYLEELIQANRIQTYDRNNASGADSTLIDILAKKRAEADEAVKRAEKNIIACLKECPIYQNGSLLTFSSNDPKKRISEGLERVVTSKFNKIGYIKTFATKNEDVSATLREAPLGMGIDAFDPGADSNNLASKEIYNYVKDEKNWGRRVTMSSLITKFGKAPYGFRPIDVRNVVAFLLVNNKLKIKVSDQLQNINGQNFVWEFSRGSQDERMVVEVQTEIDPQKLIKVKRIMKDAFDVTIELKEVELRDQSLEFFKGKLESLRQINYRNSGMYPGKALVDKMLSIFSTITASSDSETVFDKIIAKENDLVDCGDKLDMVINFHSEGGSQLNTWKAAQDLCKYYEENILFVPELGELSADINEIQKILAMEEPFGMMPKLGQLVAAAKEKQNKLLSVNAEAAKKDINKSLERITTEYNEAISKDFQKAETKDNIEQLYSDEKGVFNQLLGMLDSFERISSARSRAHTEVEAFRTALSRIIREDGEGGDVQPEVRRTSVRASNLIPVANRKIKNQDDVRRLLENIKNTLEGLLDNNDEIDID